MPKLSPFSKSKRLDIIPVGNADTGILYLLKKSDLSPCENPVSIQQAQKRSAKVSIMLLEAAQNYAEKHGVTEEQARDIILSAKTPLQFSDYLTPASKKKFDVLVEEAIKAYIAKENVSEDEAKQAVIPAMNPIVSGVSVNPLYYLSSDKQYEYLELIGSNQEVVLNAATAMIKYRRAYHCVVASRVVEGATEIQIEPAMFEASAGDRLRFGGTYLTLEEPVSYGQELIKVKPSKALDGGSVGFLIDFSTGQEKYGDPDWDVESTKEYLLNSQIEALYKFYQAEAGELKEEDDEASEGESPQLAPKLTDS